MLRWVRLAATLVAVAAYIGVMSLLVIVGTRHPPGPSVLCGMPLLAVVPSGVAMVTRWAREGDDR